MTRGIGAAIEADSISTAWLQTVRAVDLVRERRAYHLVTRIADPTAEDPDLRARVDRLLADRGDQPVETVANTIFPAGMARNNAEPGALAQRYRESYERLCRFPGNSGGTYFGRMVDYPHPKLGSVDQLTELVRKLRDEVGQRGPISARYEIAPALAGADADGHVEQSDQPGTDSLDDGVAETETAVDGTVRIVAPGHNAGRIGFPCLSWCSFQLDGEHLHLVTHYRSQYLIRRAYGNYLGLARLQEYVARAADVQPGELMVVAGYAKIDGSPRPVTDLLRETAQMA